MKASRTSATADMCAAARAHHVLFDPDPVFRDEFGVLLTSDRWRQILTSPPLRKLVMDGLLRPARPGMASVLGRARYLEDAIEAAVQRGITQYVIVGAGMDSFALRRPDLQSELTVIELDHPVTQQTKRVRLESSCGVAEGVSYVPIDFEYEDVAEALEGSSFDPRQRTLFSWMGVTQYLPKVIVWETLDSMRQCATAGCEIIFDYHTRSVRSEDGVSRKFLHALTRSVGERQIGAFDDHEMKTVLSMLGLETIDVLTGDRMNELYFPKRRDGLQAGGHVRVTHVSAS